MSHCAGCSGCPWFRRPVCGRFCGGFSAVVRWFAAWGRGDRCGDRLQALWGPRQIAVGEWGVRGSGCWRDGLAVRAPTQITVGCPTQITVGCSQTNRCQPPRQITVGCSQTNRCGLLQTNHCGMSMMPPPPPPDSAAEIEHGTAQLTVGMEVRQTNHCRQCHPPIQITAVRDPMRFTATLPWRRRLSRQGTSR